jgi:hypothetical protein
VVENRFTSSDSVQCSAVVEGEAKMSDSKTVFDRRTILVAAAGAALAFGVTGARAAKMSQTAARYQPTPKDGKQCDGCSLFVAPGSCKSVDGAISPKGWCMLWVKKPA